MPRLSVWVAVVVLCLGFEQGTSHAHKKQVIIHRVPPVLTSISPDHGIVSGSISVFGHDLGVTQDDGRVTVNGVLATTTAWLDTQVIFMIPVGAVTGPVVLTRGGLTSNALTLTVDSSGVANPISASRQPAGDTSSPNAGWAAAGVVGGIPSAAWSNCDNTACNNLVGAGAVTSATIQAALSGAQVGGVACTASAPCVVRIRAGDFSVAAFNHTYPGRVLRGAGSGSTGTNLTMTSDQSGAGLGGFNAAAIHLMSGATNTNRFASPAMNTATWTAANYTQGQTTITLSSTTGITAGAVGAGTLIFLDQLNDASDGFPAAGDLYVCEGSSGGCSNQGDANSFGRTGRAQIQAVTVTNLAGNVATISPGLSMPNWRIAATPGAFWIPTSAAAPLQIAGIEDLSIDDSPQGGGVALMIANCVNCWVQGVRIINTITNSDTETYHMWTFQAAHITVRSNYFYGKISDAGSPVANYGFSDRLTSDLVFENNIMHHMITPIVPNDPGTNNVYAYNYVDDSYTFGSTIQFHHFAEMALVEGNNLKNVLGDIIHGPHYMITVFRNHFDKNAHNQAAVVDGAVVLDTNNRFYNISGNVAGNSGYTRYKQRCPGDSGCANWTYDGDQNAFLVLGVPGSGSGTATAQDTNDGRTAFIWGNWDNVTSTADTTVGDQTGTRWCGNSSNTGWTTRCGSVTEVPSTITNYPNSIPAAETLPTSLYLSAQPAWWVTAFGTPSFPAIGPDVTCVSNCAPNVAATPTGGHAAKIPSRLCFENLGNDPAYPASSPRVRDFNRVTCYP